MQSLDEMNIDYEQQFTFEDCRHINKLRFDFFIYPNVAIEFQGKQHYLPDTYYSKNGEFQKIQLRDQIKRDYCSSHEIHLIEIPYWKINDVPDIIKCIIEDMLNMSKKSISA
jgi:hypothetical protein